MSSSVACALSRPWLSLAAQASSLARTIALALEVRAERRRLLSLDQAHCEASRSFWDLPVDRLRM